MFQSLAWRGSVLSMNSIRYPDLPNYDIVNEPGKLRG